VVLHEWTNAFSQPLDGSTNFEAAMGAARDAGVVQVNPAGNLNLSNKHIQREAAQAETVSFVFEVDEGFEDGDDVLAYQSIFGSLQWRQEHALTVVLESPSGQRVEAGVAQVGSAQIGASRLDVTRERTSRGTTVLRFFLEADTQDAAIDEGLWTFEIGGFDTSDTVYGRVTDAFSNWRPGVVWSQPTRDVSTLAFPATADAAVGVAAYAGREATDSGDGPRSADSQPAGEHLGALRGFSGRGPRIDGAQAIDIAAPDDPFVALAAIPAVLAAEWGRSWFTQFGGTSGAAPHVAASIALLRQQYPEWTPAELEARLFESARTSELEPEPGQLPDSGWGHGKLDTYRALFGVSAEPNTPPQASMSVTVDREDVVWDASQSIDPDGDALQYRFDVDYDGIWESEWTSQPRFSTRLGSGGLHRRRVARLQVRDALGARHGALAVLEAGSAGGDAGLVDVGELSDASDAGDTHLETPSGSCGTSACSTAPARPIPTPLQVGTLVGFILLWRRRGGSTK
jgi:subtilisin family serine protease